MKKKKCRSKNKEAISPPNNSAWESVTNTVIDGVDLDFIMNSVLD